MLIISGFSERIIWHAGMSRFNLAIEMLIISGEAQISCWLRYMRFNLAIEMLIISGQRIAGLPPSRQFAFQSRNRDAYHFRLAVQCSQPKSKQVVSISQSRCLSFQVRLAAASSSRHFWFQSRNRDAYHFRCKKPLRFQGLYRLVSISQSRCLSFQERALEIVLPPNLVSISQSRCLSFQALVNDGFRNIHTK